MRWTYLSDSDRSTGYEDVVDILSKYNKSLYNSMSERDKMLAIDFVKKIYRDKGIFPIVYFNIDGVNYEIQRCIDYVAEIKNGVLCADPGVGASLCNFMFRFK